MTARPTAIDAKVYAIAEIGRLMRQYDVTVADLGAARTEPTSSLVTRVLAYLGGTLVVAGLCIYLGMQWRQLDSVLRVVLTLGPGVMALAVGIIASQINPARGHLISSPLFLVAAVFQATGLFTFLAEFTTSTNDVTAHLLVCTVLAVQYLMVFLALRSSDALMFTLIFAHFAFAALFEKMGIPGRYYSTVLGLSGLLIAGQLMKTRFASITGLGFLFSGLTFTSALFVILEDTPYDLLLLGVAALMIYASVLTQSRMMLFVAIATMLSYLGYFTSEYFAHTVGWPIALMVFGLMLIVASSYAVKLGRTFKAGV